MPRPKYSKNVALFNWGGAVVDSFGTAVVLVYVLHKSIISIRFNSKFQKYLLNRYGIKLKNKK